MPALSWPVPALAALLCVACFKDLGAGDDGAPATTSGEATTATTAEFAASTTTATTTSSTSTGPVATTSDAESAGSDDAGDPICGDGIVDRGEGCDDANLTDGDGCNALCQPELCGDGLVSPLETCDDGNDLAGDGCADCQLEFLYVFVSDVLFDGALGGTLLADQRCLQEAEIAGLSGTYLAWLSTDPDTTPLTRFSSGDLAYMRTDQMTVAPSLEYLTSFGPDVSISLLADGKPLPSAGDGCNNLVWTGTEKDGSAAMLTCAGFTSNKLENTGVAGNYAAVGVTWTNACPPTCDQPARIYCFQQVP